MILKKADLSISLSFSTLSYFDISAKYPDKFNTNNISPIFINKCSRLRLTQWKKFDFSYYNTPHCSLHFTLRGWDCCKIPLMLTNTSTCHTFPVIFTEELL